jgi:hypothetical protein
VFAIDVLECRRCSARMRLLGAILARAWQVYTKVDYARMCLARGGAKARARANQYLPDARKLAGELGIVSIEREAAALLE